jgi:5' nucleotidase family
MQKSGWVVLALLSHEGVPLGVQSFSSISKWLSPTNSVRHGTLKRWASSVDIDSDEEAIHPVKQGGVDNANGEIGGGRYDDLVADLGLEGKLKRIHLLPSKRKVSPYDVFCNREVKQEKLAAVGFDMDYTLCQYKQPAFDKLAFDGAKEKLVNKLGYPKGVLEFEYDHEVITMQNFC